MRKITSVISFLAMALLLAGCISIPVGEDTVKISANGVEWLTNDEGGQEEAVEDTAGETDHEEVAVEPESTNEQAEPASHEEENNDGLSEEESNDSSNEATITSQCEKQDYSAVTDHLAPNFFIPECAELTDLSKDKNSLTAYLTVEGDWQKTFQAYKDFFDDKLSSENQQISSQTARLTAYLYEDMDAYTQIDIDQRDEHVMIRIIQRFPVTD